MTTAQIISLALLAAVAAWAYLPSLLGSIRIPTFAPKSQDMRDIEAVVKIRSNSRTAEVVEACNQLLAVLLQVKK